MNASIQCSCHLDCKVASYFCATNLFQHKKLGLVMGSSSETDLGRGNKGPHEGIDQKILLYFIFTSISSSQFILE